MYWSISQKYLSAKKSLTSSLTLFNTRPELVIQFEKELEITIGYYNKRRLNNSFYLIPWDYLINARELNIVLNVTYQVLDLFRLN